MSTQDWKSICDLIRKYLRYFKKIYLSQDLCSVHLCLGTGGGLLGGLERERESILNTIIVLWARNPCLTDTKSSKLVYDWH